MSGWNAGYVTDIPYIPGYYRQQSPAHLDLVARLAGATFRLPEDFVWIELGCGVGYGAAMVAAANPDARVIGIDFNPAHIAEGQLLAAEAGLDNLTFLEADLATLAESPLLASIPVADVVTMHGVWSWVSDTVRAGIVRFFDARVRPGGLVHLSYNALPTWQGALAYQRIVHEAGKRLAVRSDQQAMEGVGVALALRDAKAQHLTGEMSSALMDRARSMPPAYLAHEYMNGAWRPVFFADVAQALAGAKLEFAGSALPLEQFPDLIMSEAQREIYERFDDPAMRETVKDVCLGRALRQDVFIRGLNRLGRRDRDAALFDLSLGLAVPLDDFAYEAEMPAGHASFSPDFYRPIAAALSERPHTVRELLALPDAKGRKDNPSEVAGVLVGTEQAIPMRRPGAAQTRQAAALNDALAQRLSRPGLMGMGFALCSHAIGGGMPGMPGELHALRIAQAGDGAEAIQSWVERINPDGDAAQRTAMAETFAKLLAERPPFWRRMGVL